MTVLEQRFYETMIHSMQELVNEVKETKEEIQKLTKLLELQKELSKGGE